MARKKISEFRAKKLVNELLGVEYTGVSVGPEDNVDVVVKELGNPHGGSLSPQPSLRERGSSSEEELYVVKVDQGVKKRGKQGLVKVKLTIDDLRFTIDELRNKGFQYFIIEEFVPHEGSEEKYLALSRTRDGLELSYSKHGGVDIEENADTIQTVVVPTSHGIASPNEDARNDSVKTLKQVQDDIGVETSVLFNIIDAFEKYYFSFLEINPLLVQGQAVTLLDLAVEVDSSAEFFVKGAWTEEDYRDYSVRPKTQEEENIAELSKQSQASFSLTVLNPDGAIWMLLSGGGASIVLADEAYNQGSGKDVGNYGEYSGNPNEEETYYYTKQVLSVLFKSSSQKKVLIIGGGVANFTDVRKTFKGVIRAIDEVKDRLVQSGVKVFVRRGGPNQEEGLKNMKEFLESNNLYGLVSGLDIILTDVMNKALQYIKD